MSSGLEHLSIKAPLWQREDTGGVIVNHTAETVASSRSTILALGLLMLVAVGLYVNTLGNDFTNWDDQMVYSNWQTRSLAWENIRKIFTYVRG